VAKQPRVTVRDRSRVTDLCWNGTATRVAGVRLAGGEVLDAALVVDASGRFSKLPQRLVAAGYPRPVEKVVDAGLAYATMVLDAPSRDFEALQHMNSAPDRPRGTFAVHVEGGRWVVTVFGAGGDHPPTDERGWRKFAENLGNADLDALLESATPVPGLGVHGFKRTENRRNDYAAMRRWPRRLVAIGDSVAAFDPVFGQGMTVSVLQAEALGHALAKTDDLDAVAHRAQRRVAAIARTPWLMSVSEDLAWHYYRERGALPLWLRRPCGTSAGSSGWWLPTRRCSGCSSASITWSGRRPRSVARGCWPRCSSRPGESTRSSPSQPSKARSQRVMRQRDRAWEKGGRTCRRPNRSG